MTLVEVQRRLNNFILYQSSMASISDTYVTDMDYEVKAVSWYAPLGNGVTYEVIMDFYSISTLSPWRHYEKLPAAPGAEGAAGYKKFESMYFEKGDRLVLSQNATAYPNPLEVCWFIHKNPQGEEQETVKKCDLINWILGRCD